MHITLEADYAIRIVDHLARSTSRVRAQALANKNEVTLRFALKILSKLVASGIVRSYKGALGGYELARPADEIAINDIIEVIQGPYEFSRCLNIKHVCFKHSNGNVCPYHHLFSQVSEQVRSQLKQTKISDMLDYSPDKTF